MSSSIVPRVADRDSTHAQVELGSLYVTYTVGPATGAHIRSLVRNFDAFASGSRGPIGFILATKESTRPPESEHRRAVQDMMGKHADKLAGLAMCIEAAGFTGSIIRSVAAAIFVLPNPGYPVKFFSSPIEAVPWMATTLGMAPDAVRAAVQFAIAQVDAG